MRMSSPEGVRSLVEHLMYAFSPEDARLLVHRLMRIYSSGEETDGESHEDLEALSPD